MYLHWLMGQGLVLSSGDWRWRCMDARSILAVKGTHMLACILRSCMQTLRNILAIPQFIHCSITCLIILMWQTAAAEFMFTQRKVIMRPKITTLSTAVSEVRYTCCCSTCICMHGYDIHYVVAVCRCTLVFDSDLIIMRNDDINQTTIRDHCTSWACQ